jgi:hypothetical protein
MRVSYPGAHRLYAKRDMYTDVNPAAFAWHRKIDPLGEHLKAEPDMPARASLSQLSRMRACRRSLDE